MIMLFNVCTWEICRISRTSYCGKFVLDLEYVVILTKMYWECTEERSTWVIMYFLQICQNELGKLVFLKIFFEGENIIPTIVTIDLICHHHHGDLYWSWKFVRDVEYIVILTKIYWEFIRDSSTWVIVYYLQICQNELEKLTFLNTFFEDANIIPTIVTIDLFSYHHQGDLYWSWILGWKFFTSLHLCGLRYLQRIFNHVAGI